MKYLIIDACISGTGIRDKYEGYISLEDLKLHNATVDSINRWLSKYETEHYNGFINTNVINNLDKEGIKIAKKIKEELNDVKIQYFSAAKMTLEII